MRAFVILSFIAVASAGRLGYNYQPTLSGSYSSGSNINTVPSLGSGLGLSGSGTSFLSGIGGYGNEFGGQGQGYIVRYGLGSGSIGSGLDSGVNFGYGGQSLGSGFNIGSASIGSGIGSGLGSGINYGSSDSFGSDVSYGQGTNRVIDGGLNKEYYIFSAPEEQAPHGHNSQSSTTYLKKNLRVIFIKAPENNGVHNAALQIAKQATEDRTAIYVLSKEPDVSEIANQVQEISENVRAKPEVRFIKYRTPQDALHAQHSIQQQYEALGGSSHSSNEGVAPVLNFASPAASHSGNGHGLGHGLGGGSNLIPSSSSLSSSLSDISSPVVSFASPSDQSSGSVDLGNIRLSSLDSGNEYLPPGVKK